MRIEVLLQCEHVAVFTVSPPRVGERIYCMRCADMRRVTGAPSDWRAVCDTCAGLNVTRKSPAPMRRHLVVHLTANPEHVVTVWQLGTTEAVKVRYHGRMLQGFDEASTLPFGA